MPEMLYPQEGQAKLQSQVFLTSDSQHINTCARCKTIKRYIAINISSALRVLYLDLVDELCIDNCPLL